MSIGDEKILKKMDKKWLCFEGYISKIRPPPFFPRKKMTKIRPSSFMKKTTNNL